MGVTLSFSCPEEPPPGAMTFWKLCRLPSQWQQPAPLAPLDASQLVSISCAHPSACLLSVSTASLPQIASRLRDLWGLVTSENWSNNSIEVHLSVTFPLLLCSWPHRATGQHSPQPSSGCQCTYRGSLSCCPPSFLASFNSSWVLSFLSIPTCTTSVSLSCQLPPWTAQKQGLSGTFTILLVYYDVSVVEQGLLPSAFTSRLTQNSFEQKLSNRLCNASVCVQ